MKNRGFTLLELIVVIGLLSLIGTIVIINVRGSYDDTNQKFCNSFVDEIEDAACIYVVTHECKKSNCVVRVSDLISEGLIKSDKDPCRKNAAVDGTKTVTVTWNSDGLKTCTYNGTRTYEN